MGRAGRIRGCRVSRRSFPVATLAIVLAAMLVLGASGESVIGWSPPGASAAPLAAPDTSIVLQPFLSGLSSPVLITNAHDGSGRLFVVEQGGLIKVVKNGAVNGTPFLDLRSLV